MIYLLLVVIYRKHLQLKAGSMFIISIDTAVELVQFGIL